MRPSDSDGWPRRRVKFATSIATRSRACARSRNDCVKPASVAADDARHAAMEAVRATADSLTTTLEQMKAIEEMRQTLRDIKALNSARSN
jgi:hypothetical protein